MEKARFFHKKLTGSDFSASRGWLDNFKKRHGIRQLKVSGEKVSSNTVAVQPFQEKFLNEIKEKNLCPEQIYNADESGLYVYNLSFNAFLGVKCIFEMELVN